MADEATTPPRRRANALRDPNLLAACLYSLLALIAVVTAYFTIFTRFSGYDDEGTLLVSLNAFAEGDVLYRDVYSVYGPFFYELFGGLFALTGDVTTDASRSIVVLLWVATSLLFGIGAQRLSGMLTVGLVSMATAFAALGVLVNEPMHPQGLCVLLLAAVVLVLSREPSRHTLLAGAAVGALLAALTMTKINLGIFAVAGLVVAAAWTLGPSERLRPLRYLAVAGFLLLPLVVTARDLGVDWTREMALLVTLAMTAVLVAAWPLRGGDATRSPLGRWLVAAAGAFVAGLLAIFAIVLLTGATPADVYQGAIVEAMRVRDVLVLRFGFPPAALDWAIGALVVAILVTRLRPLGEGKPSPWPGALRLLAGLVILFNVAHIVPFGLQPSIQNPNIVPMVLAWVAAIPPHGEARSTYERFLRVALPLIAVAETLQAYPVSGSQAGIASLTFVPVGALCIGDGVASLRAWTATRGRIAASRFAVTVPLVGFALVGLFTLDTMLRGGVSNVILYRDLERLPLRGATAMRMNPAEVETYTRLVDLLRQYRCTTFVGYPNVNSLYLWSGIEPPKPAAPGAWINALDADYQRMAVEDMRSSPRPCVIRNPELAEFWLQGTPAPDRPLVRHVLDDFETVTEVNGFEFGLPTGGGRRGETS
ncbi:MAG TPA: hypothetical protein VJU14_12595 [Solirubrobacterales bacterium]|nr:hypothetical protein [Solirubrobacterales bacterium]